jgi:hypothetical protein
MEPSKRKEILGWSVREHAAAVEIERWRDGEMVRWRDGEKGSRREGEKGRNSQVEASRCYH